MAEGISQSQEALEGRNTKQTKGFLEVFHRFSEVFLGVSQVFLRFSQVFLGFQRFFMVFLRFFLGFHRFSWVFKGFSQVFRGFLGFSQVFHRFSWVSNVFKKGCFLAFLRILKGFRWKNKTKLFQFFVLENPSVYGTPKVFIAKGTGVLMVSRCPCPGSSWAPYGIYRVGFLVAWCLPPCEVVPRKWLK